MAIAPPLRLPDPVAIGRMLTGLVGKDVVVTSAPNGSAGDVALFATYVDVLGLPLDVIEIDLPLAASIGAALAVIPVIEAQTWIEAGDLPEDGRDNAAEVLNVLAAAFNDANPGSHVKLDAAVDGDSVAERRHLVENLTPRARAVHRVEVDGYPGGTMVVSLAARGGTGSTSPL